MSAQIRPEERNGVVVEMAQVGRRKEHIPEEQRYDRKVVYGVRDTPHVITVILFAIQVRKRL